MKLKADFHIHTKGDPSDKLIRHSVFDIIDRAKENNFDVLAITHHRRVYFSEEAREYAESKGILLIPAVELEIHSMHVIMLNPPSHDVSGIKDFSDIIKFKNASNALIIAPHPFFPGANCLNSNFFKNRELFDAVEINGVYTSWLNYNKSLKSTLKDDEIPIVGSSDTHFLSQFGLTYSLVEAEKNIDSILEAIRKNKVEVISRPLTVKDNGLFTVGIFIVTGSLREIAMFIKRYIGR